MPPIETATHAVRMNTMLHLAAIYMPPMRGLGFGVVSETGIEYVGNL